MSKQRLAQSILICAAVQMVGWGHGASVGCADDSAPVAALPHQTLPTPPRFQLPGPDCLNCPGPVPTAPCFDTHRGFLYYGTYPWDDDPANGFDDCPGGRCGYPGARLSLWWIRLHQHDRHVDRGAAGCRSCGVSPAGGKR